MQVIINNDVRPIIVDALIGNSNLFYSQGWRCSREQFVENLLDDHEKDWCKANEINRKDLTLA